MAKNKEKKPVAAGDVVGPALIAAGLAIGVGTSAVMGPRQTGALAEQIVASEQPYLVRMESGMVDALKERQRVMRWLQSDAPRSVTVRWGDSEKPMFASDLKAVLEKISDMPNVKVYDTMAHGKVVKPAVVAKEGR